MKSYRLIALLAAIMLSLAGTSLAQVGVGVSPPRAELRALPGEQRSQTVVVNHPGPRGTIEVTTSLGDILLQPTGESVLLEPGSHPRSLAAWLSINPLQFSLEPQSRQDVRYTVQVPAEAAPGTYWVVLFFDSETPGTDAPGAFSSLTTQVRVGHLIYVTVGEPTLGGQIVSIRHEQSEIRTTFQNTGNGLLRLSGRVEVRNSEGELLQTLAIANQASLPGATHDLVTALPEPLGSGTYVLLAVLDYGAATVVAGEAQIGVP
jgi:hypothetical protein